MIKIKPIIGITSNYIDDDKFFMDQGLGARSQVYSAVAIDYFNAVKEAGGIPVIIAPTRDEEALTEILDRLDGVILTGGNDVGTHYYNERPSSKLGRIIPLRDESDFFIADYVLTNNIPTLGICRGAQILNVAIGGSLIQDIPSDGYLDHTLKSSEKYVPTHSVQIDKDSFLYEAYGSEEIFVNSYHHQGLKDLGEGSTFRCIARTEDNLCEAIQGDDSEFFLGVQWHPEMMFEKDKRHLEVFKLFIKKCIELKEK